ncbi:MAG: hypothetical protein JSW46_04320 [Gemmatimonadota bacterium]|nr:MAG: hypothetical protein JSW46_04320 [Gemmatimonadota bacterium]
MSDTLSLYAFEPGTPGVPAGSGTGVFVTGLVSLLRSFEPGLAIRTHWLRPAEEHAEGRFSAWRAGVGWLTREILRLLKDDSDYLVLIYPKIPVLAHVDQPAMLRMAHRAYQLLGAKTGITGQRIVVIVEDLPVEMEAGRAVAGGRAQELDARIYHKIEAALFRAAYRLVVPNGFVALLSDRYRLHQERFRPFRRNIYLPVAESGVAPPLEFESGSVNFFYAGSVDTHVAANFREVLRSIRNAPDTRLHVCGPGRDAVQEWLSELDVPNVRHHGQLGVAEHDWLAERCDVGLILYPSDNPYNHITPTMKYSAYLANGLAVLSTDLKCVVENIRQDGVGQAMPIRELALEIMRWAAKPSLWSEAKVRANEEAAIIRSGDELKGWIEEIAEPG